MDHRGCVAAWLVTSERRPREQWDNLNWLETSNEQWSNCVCVCMCDVCLHCLQWRLQPLPPISRRLLLLGAADVFRLVKIVTLQMERRRFLLHRHLCEDKTKQRKKNDNKNFIWSPSHWCPTPVTLLLVGSDGSHRFNSNSQTRDRIFWFWAIRFVQQRVRTSAKIYVSATLLVSLSA